MTRKKRVLFLGAGPFQIAPIIYARSVGHYAITCDYRPDNPGHRFADESHNISTVDANQILQLAERLGIDGIVSYASDVSAWTAAFVSERLGIPGNSTDAVGILTDKSLFRKCLVSLGMNCPEFKSFDADAVGDAGEYVATSPDSAWIIKPVDSSGSKGVTVVSSRKQVCDAFTHAASFSRSKRVIVEQFVERDGFQIAGDGFVTKGRLAFCGFGNEHFCKLPSSLVPIGESFPSVLDESKLMRIRADLGMILKRVGFDEGAINFDLLIDKHGEIYILEIGPRNGGNLIPDTLKIATGVDTIAATVEAAVGNEYCLDESQNRACCSSYVLHAHKAKVFTDLWTSPTIKQNIVHCTVNVASGTQVSALENASKGIGALILKFSCMEEMLDRMENMSKYVAV